MQKVDALPRINRGVQAVFHRYDDTSSHDLPALVRVNRAQRGFPGLWWDPLAAANGESTPIVKEIDAATKAPHLSFSTQFTPANDQNNHGHQFGKIWRGGRCVAETTPRITCESVR